MKGFKFILVIAIVGVLLSGGILFAGTLADVKAKGVIAVGVNEGLFGFSKPDEKGVWRGLDVDTARAVAVAVFGEYEDRLRFTPLTAKTRFTALQSKEIDVLTRNATQTLGRDTSLGLDFVQVNYYDGQGFMVPKTLGVKSATELGGATVCVLPGTTTEQNAADFFRSNQMDWKTVTIESTAELSQAFYAGRCDVMTSDASQLAGLRASAPTPEDYMILPEIISKEPLAPAVRHGDNQWKDIVNYAVLAMINAEELGISQPAMSNGLQRLRKLFNDPLLVRTGNGMSPTERAERLQPLVRQIVASVEKAVESEQVFEPARANRVFRISVSDYTESTLVPLLLRHMRSRAPNITLDFLTPSDVTFGDLEQGKVDMVIVGSDRIAANGDVANKIGTYGVAVLAREMSYRKRYPIPEEVFVAGIIHDIGQVVLNQVLGTAICQSHRLHQY